MVAFHEGHKELAYELPSVAPMTATAAAIAVIVLTILGLVNVVPAIMLAVATIVVGAAILLQGANTASEYVHALSDGSGQATALGGGITLEFLAGGAGIVLGILALFTHAMVLAPAALIVFGGALLLSGSVAARSTSTSTAPATATPTATPEDMAVQTIAREAAAATAGAEALVGIAAIILGILALIPIQGGVLTLIGLLAVGAALLMSSATLASMLRLLRL